MPRRRARAVTGRHGTAAWIAVAFAVAAILTATGLLAFGAGDEGTRIALRVTARWSYLLFWPAYAGPALAALAGPAFQPLARHARELGLAFAAAHLPHLGLVVWLYSISERPPVSTLQLGFFGVAAFFTYLLALLSLGSLAATLRPGAWRLLRTVGVEYIALVFLVDFLRNPLGGGRLHIVAYAPFVALGILGVILRATALVRRARRYGGTPISERAPPAS
jgi:hypothetical protein